MRRHLGAVLVLALVATACGTREPTAAGEEASLNVVASFYPLAEAASRVGGGRVRVVNLTPPGAEPHDIELTTRQLDSVIDADLVLYSGGGFQPSVEDAVKRARGAKLDVLEGLDVMRNEAHMDEDDDDHGHDEGGLDPHVWLDPVLMAAIVDRIQEALATADPDGAGDYRDGADAFRAELRELDEAYTEGLRTCARRKIVTAHASFGYLARRYGLEAEAVTGLSPEAEPNPARLAELIDLVGREGVTTVYTESPAGSRVARTLAREAEVEVAVLHPIEGLTAAEVEAGKTYASVMHENLDALRRGLDCA